MLAVTFSMGSKAQGVVGLDHLLRKSKLDSLIVPCQTMNPKHFNIKFPDSIYNQSKITVIRLNLDGIRRIKLQLFSKNRKVYNVKYTIRGARKLEKFEDLMLNSLNLDFEGLEKTSILKLNSCTVRVEKTKVKNKYIIQFKIE